MKSRDILASVILIGAAIFVAATIFIKPASERTTDLELYGWLFDEKTAEAEAPKAVPVRVYETPKALGDQLWSILLPKTQKASFSGTGGQLNLLNVSTGSGGLGSGGGEGNALLMSDEFKAAADGALSGTDQGIADLLSYFDAAGGNETIIAYRAQLLLEALTKDSTVANSLSALQEATTNISEAAFTALWTGYVMEVNYQPNFAVQPNAIGYDLGPVMQADGDINPVYDDFIRVPAESRHVQGSASDIETSTQLLWGDGVKSIQAFVAPIPNGVYRVYVMTSSEGGVDPSVAFGDYSLLKRDTPVRRVDLRPRTDAYEEWRRQACGEREATLEQPVFTPGRPDGSAYPDCRPGSADNPMPVAEILMAQQGISAEIEPELSMASLASDQTQGMGSVYALRIEVKNGQLYVDFNQGYAPSYVVGIMVVAADDSFGAEMSAMVSAVLETVHPAAGGGGTQGPGLATNFAATSLPTGGGGTGGSGGGGSGSPGGGIPTGPSGGGTGGDGTGGDGDGTGGDGSGGDGTGGDGTGGGGQTAQLVAEGLGPYEGFFGDELTLDGTQSTYNGQLILSAVDNPADLLVEWLFDIDGDGTYETLVSNDLVALIDSSIFGSTGQFQGILRLTYNGLVSIDQVLVILFGPGTSVPEPGMLLLLALALAALLLLHHRRRRRG
jgi:hypothetical protein